MNLIIHSKNNKQIAELVAEEIVINNVDDALDLLGDAGYNKVTGIVIQEKQLCKEFFNLSTRIAGEILQKFSNYNMKLAIVGEFTKYKSLRDFIYESNKAGHIVFVPTQEEAIHVLIKNS